MAKPEWGTKRTCPKCSTRFYDLEKENPVVCIECGNEWIPEPVLKTKQPVIIDDKESKDKNSDEDDADSDDDLDIDEDDLVGDVSLDDDDDDEVSGIVDTSLSDDNT